MYNPEIDFNRIVDLYRLRESYRKIGIWKPMTHLVNHAIDNYIRVAEKELNAKGGRLLTSKDLPSKFDNDK